MFLFRIALSPLCSFCNTEEETVVHIFYSCVFAKNLWSDLKKSLESVLHLPDLTPQSAIFGFFDIDPSIYLITNHLLLIFKFHVYSARSIKKVNIDILKRKIKKVQETEKNISQTNENKYAKYKKKFEISRTTLVIFVKDVFLINIKRNIGVSGGVIYSTFLCCSSCI